MRSANSLMSIRTIASGSLNRNLARARAVSVLPTPVGPRIRNAATGRRGCWSPTRDRRTARAIASMGLSWPTMVSCSSTSIVRRRWASVMRTRLASIPVRSAMTAATASVSTWRPTAELARRRERSWSYRWRALLLAPLLPALRQSTLALSRSESMARSSCHRCMSASRRARSASSSAATSSRRRSGRSPISPSSSFASPDRSATRASSTAISRGGVFRAMRTTAHAPSRSSMDRAGSRRRGR